MTYSESEKAWLKRRAKKIAAESGRPLLAACSAAIAELARLREQPKGRVVPFPQRGTTAAPS